MILPSKLLFLFLISYLLFFMKGGLKFLEDSLRNLVGMRLELVALVIWKLNIMLLIVSCVISERYTLWHWLLYAISEVVRKPRYLCARFCIQLVLV